MNVTNGVCFVSGVAIGIVLFLWWLFATTDAPPSTKLPDGSVRYSFGELICTPLTDPDDHDRLLGWWCRSDLRHDYGFGDTLGDARRDYERKNARRVHP